MTNKKDIKRQRAELLGMPYGTAEKQLRKAIIYELAQQLGKNVCRWCNSAIDSPDDLAITHVQDWQEDAASFWDLANVAFSHVSCAAERGGKRQEEVMSRIEVIVEDENGKRLAGTRHKNQLYVAGNKNQRYNIKVRNKTGKRILVVCTVDGRNVITGKVGSYEDTGHVIGAFDSYTFEGWRQDSDTVAAFRFGKKKQAYSSQMGTPENVGVIGVAVFEEYEHPKPVITVKEKEYIPYPVPTPWPRPWDPYPIQPRPIWTRPVWIYEPTITFGTSDNSHFSTGGHSYGGGGGGTYTCSTAPLSSLADTLAQGNTSEGEIFDINAVQTLGTAFGEDLESSVVDVDFRRATDNPIEVHTIRYDTKANLEKQGIEFRRPSKRKKPGKGKPSPFPKEPSGGYCKPPRQRIYYK